MNVAGAALATILAQFVSVIISLVIIRRQPLPFSFTGSDIGYFNGHGKTLPVMIQGISSSFLMRVPLSYLFSIQPGANLVTIGLAVPLTSIYGILFFTVCYIMLQRKKGPISMCITKSTAFTALMASSPRIPSCHPLITYNPFLFCISVSLLICFSHVFTVCSLKNASIGSKSCLRSHFSNAL